MLTHACQMDEHAHVHTCTRVRMHACAQAYKMDEHARMAFLVPMRQDTHSSITN
jgi:hypothetical protein